MWGLYPAGRHGQSRGGRDCCSEMYKSKLIKTDPLRKKNCIPFVFHLLMHLFSASAEIFFRKVQILSNVIVAGWLADEMLFFLPWSNSRSCSAGDSSYLLLFPECLILNIWLSQTFRSCCLLSALGSHAYQSLAAARFSTWQKLGSHFSAATSRWGPDSVLSLFKMSSLLCTSHTAQAGMHEVNVAPAMCLNVPPIEMFRCCCQPQSSSSQVWFPVSSRNLLTVNFNLTWYLCF